MRQQCMAIDAVVLTPPELIRPFGPEGTQRRISNQSDPVGAMRVLLTPLTRAP